MNEQQLIKEYLASTYEGSYNQWIQQRTHAQRAHATQHLTKSKMQHIIQIPPTPASKMITDKRFKIAITQDGKPATLELVLSGAQIENTMRRRVLTLQPGARILDMHEMVTDEQRDLLSGSKKR